MKTAIVTGATSGIGLSVVRELLANDFFVIGVGHSQTNSAAALASLKSDGLDPVVYFTGDLMQQREVNRLAGEMMQYLEQHNDGRLDVLINNAGGVRSWYATTEDGYEQQFALNHLAGFLLTRRLLPCLHKAGGRVIFTGSGSHKGCGIHWQDVMFRRHYRPLGAYKQSKLCNMLSALELNNRYASSGVHAYVVDPGLVRTEIGCKQTGGLVSLVWSIRKRQGHSPQVPARTYAFLCRQEQPPAGLYYRNSKPRSYSRSVTADNARRLFTLSEKLCGI